MVCYRKEKGLLQEVVKGTKILLKKVVGGGVC